MTFYNVRNLSYLLKQDCSVVITGDSLAYNRYDFVEEPRMNAWDCPFSMKSWSFLLRDYLVSHSLGWIPGCKLEIESPNISTTLFKKHNLAPSTSIINVALLDFRIVCSPLNGSFSYLVLI